MSLDNILTPLICIVSGFLQQRFGPLRLLMFACLPYILGWVAASLATSHMALYISRSSTSITSSSSSSSSSSKSSEHFINIPDHGLHLAAFQIMKDPVSCYYEAVRGLRELVVI